MLNRKLYILKSAGIPDLKIRIIKLVITRDRSAGPFNMFKMSVIVPTSYIGNLNMLGGYVQSIISIYSPDGLTDVTATIMGSVAPLLKHVVRKCFIEDHAPADSVTIVFEGFTAPV